MRVFSSLGKLIAIVWMTLKITSHSRKMLLIFHSFKRLNQQKSFVTNLRFFLVFVILADAKKISFEGQLTVSNFSLECKECRRYFSAFPQANLLRNFLGFAVLLFLLYFSLVFSRALPTLHNSLNFFISSCFLLCKFNTKHSRCNIVCIFCAD
jgi:hypothetical protein